MLTLQELQKASIKTLLEELEKTRRANVQLRMALKSDTSKDIHKLHIGKKYVARVLTVVVAKTEALSNAK